LGEPENNQMKKYLAALTIFLGTWTLILGTCSFVYLDANPQHWSSADRALAGMMSLAFSVILTLAYILEQNEKK